VLCVRVWEGAVCTPLFQPPARHSNKNTTVTHLDVAVCKQVLHQCAVNAAHAGVVDGKAKGQQVAQLRRLGRLSLRLWGWLGGCVWQGGG
jgi:hypothetical protein